MITHIPSKGDLTGFYDETIESGWEDQLKANAVADRDLRRVRLAQLGVVAITTETIRPDPFRRWLWKFGRPKKRAASVYKGKA